MIIVTRPPTTRTAPTETGATQRGGGQGSPPKEKHSEFIPAPAAIEAPTTKAAVETPTPIFARRTRSSTSSDVYPSTVRGVLGTTSTPAEVSFSCSAGPSAARSVAGAAGSTKASGRQRSRRELPSSSPACALAPRGEATSPASTQMNPNRRRTTKTPFRREPPRSQLRHAHPACQRILPCQKPSQV